jgi:hypothetical protein
MPKRSMSSDEALSAPLYGLAVLLMAVPLLDFLQSIGPLRPANVQWRFATVGLLSGVLLTPMLGLSIAMVLAAVRGQPRLQRILSLFSLLVATTLTLLLISFVLDALQVANVVPEQGRSAFRSASIKAVLKQVSVAAVLFVLGLRGWGISASRGRRRDAHGQIPLVSK